MWDRDLDINCQVDFEILRNISLKGLPQFKTIFHLIFKSFKKVNKVLDLNYPESVRQNFEDSKQRSEKSKLENRGKTYLLKVAW